ncbi:MAG: hypothetical protein DWQ08_02235 [Proteobacteria bacterium]|nr:MAG: hypothetical protein DWQ08_02235 [Pseudomonadota bacterium]
MYFDEVLPDVFVGTCPARVIDATRLRRGLGVTAVLNLQTDADFERWNVAWPAPAAAYPDLEIVVERVPIVDFDGNDLALRIGDAAQRLARLLSVGHRVYVHCTAGQQRSPAAVIAYLVRERGMALSQAAREVIARHPCAPDMAALESALGTESDADRPPPNEKESS